MGTDERRKVERIQAFRAVELSSPSKARRCGVTRNASPTGLLIATPSKFAAGDALEIAMHLDRGTEHLQGKVVRVDTTPADCAEPWRFWVAVQLDAEISEDLLEEAQRPPPPSQRPSASA
jgi:hypothetical protein